MRLKDFIETLSQYDPDTELVIDLDGKFVTPSISRDMIIQGLHIKIQQLCFQNSIE